MKLGTARLLVAITLLLTAASLAGAEESELFFGQKPPGKTPVPFAYPAFSDAYQAHLPPQRVGICSVRGVLLLDLDQPVPHTRALHHGL